MKNSLTLPAGISALALCAVAAILAPAPAPLAGGATVIDTLPYSIDTPGAYCLTSNLTASPGLGGISVNTSDVTIDLGGFNLSGVGGQGTGISSTSIRIEIRNGGINNWSSHGISVGPYSTVKNVDVAACTGVGVRTGSQSIVSDCTLRYNVGGSLELSANSLVSNCALFTPFETDESVKVGAYSVVRDVISEGGGTGFVGGVGSRFVNCTASGFLVRGFHIADLGQVDGCFARGVVSTSLSAQTAISVGHHGRVSNCNASTAEIGIDVGPYSVVKDSTVYLANRDGILADEGTRIVECSVSYTNPSNRPTFGAGIRVGNGVVVKSTTSGDNHTTGIHFAGIGGVADECATFYNTDGMRLSNLVLARDNWVSENAQDGIIGSGDRMLLIGNAVDQNTRGIVLEGQKSLLVGNRASGNSGPDYTVPFGNPTGPINQNAGTIQGSLPQANFKTPF